VQGLGLTIQKGGEGTVMEQNSKMAKRGSEECERLTYNIHTEI
jgi:hypothetical protein